MQKIEAIFRPLKLEEVAQAPRDMGMRGVTVTETRGIGRAIGPVEICRAHEFTNSYMPKVEIEAVLADDQMRKAVEVIQNAAAIGLVGDGGNFISAVQEALRIHTGQSATTSLLRIAASKAEENRLDG